MGGGISIEEASVGPGKPDHVPSGLCSGTGSRIGADSRGAKGVGVVVASGLGVARGPSHSLGDEQLESRIKIQR